MLATVLLVLVLLWLIGFYLFARVNPVPRGLSLYPSLSVVIPARNEEMNLERLLPTLTGYPGESEILLVDDNSDDNTAAVATRLKAQVVKAPAHDPQWTGKTRACFLGAQQARYGLLLFVDADTFFRDGGLRKIVELYKVSGGHAMSLLPFHETPTIIEKLSLFFNLLMAMGTGAFAFKKAQNARLVGQSLVISKNDYFKVGGHAVVKEQILENYFLSQKIEEAGMQNTTYLGKGVLHMRMFPQGFWQLWEGWGKAFAKGSSQVSPGLLLLCVLWLVGAMSVVVFAPLLGLKMFGVFYLLFALQIYLFSRKVGSFSWLASLFYPLPLVFYFVLFSVSLYKLKTKRSVTWSGRSLSG